MAGLVLVDEGAVRSDSAVPADGHGVAHCALPRLQHRPKVVSASRSLVPRIGHSGEVDAGRAAAFVRVREAVSAAIVLIRAAVALAIVAAEQARVAALL